MKTLNNRPLSPNKKRRKFLKKALYATPTLVMLGSLIKPNDLLADYDPSGVPYKSVPTNTQTSGKSLNNSTSL